MTDLDAQIETVNQKLRGEGIPHPSIVRREQKLYLRGTFSPQTWQWQNSPLSAEYWPRYQCLCAGSSLR